jgi:hypothetical protein
VIRLFKPATTLRLIFVWALLFCVFLILTPDRAHASYAEMPTILPEGGPGTSDPSRLQFINLNNGPASDEKTGYGATVPTSFIKLYSQDGNARNIDMGVVVRRVGEEKACKGYNIEWRVLLLDSSGVFAGYGQKNGYGSGTGIAITRCTIGPGLSGSYQFSISAGQLRQQTGNPDTTHNGLYEAILEMKVVTDTSGGSNDNSASYPNKSATLRFNVDSGGRLGYAARPYVYTLYPSYDQTFNNAMSAKFRPPCTIGPATSTYIRWYDDDYEDPTDPPGSNPDESPFDGNGTLSQFDDPRPIINEYDPKVSLTVPVRSDIGTRTRVPGGSDGWGRMDFTMNPGMAYELLIQSVDGGNGIQFDVPFDSGDFYLQCPPPPQPPRMYVDGVSTCGSVYGWAFDQDNTGASIQVHIYRGGQAGGGGVLVGNVTANGSRADVNAAFGISGNHGFNFAIPPEDMDGNDKTYYVYAIDSNGPDNTGADPYYREGLSGGTNPITMTGCGKFHLDPSVSGEALSPDSESPNQFCGNVGVTATYPGWAASPPASGVPATSQYWFTKNGVTVSGPTGYAGNAGNSRFINSNANYCTGISGYTAGDSYCLLLSITPTDGIIDKNGNVISSSGSDTASGSCNKINNLPYLRTYGADIVAGGGFINSTCGASTSGIFAFMRPLSEQTSASNRSGSGTQLAAMALGTISGFTSASLRTNPPASNAGNGLTFAHGSTAPDQFSMDAVLGGGMSGNGWCAPDYYADTQFSDSDPRKTVSTTLGAISLAALPTNQQTRRDINNGKIRVTGTNNYNIRHTVYVDGDVYLLNDIAYTPTYADIGSIPNFTLIVKGNIYIDNRVRRIDGLYIAQPRNDGSKGRIYTCAREGGAIADSAVLSPSEVYTYCGGDGTDRRLIVNGALVANRIVFNRAAFSLRDSRYQEGPYMPNTDSHAAEIVNFSPEMFLGPPVFRPTGSQTSGDYDYIATLPPIL